MMTATTVEVRNFQAIDRAAFDIEGLTVVVGRSNIGKSALVRAIKCALTGAEGSDFVRHDPKSCARIQRGAKKCKCHSSVRIEFPNGNVVLWEKGDAINQYTTWVEGEKQVYSRVGRSPELPPVLGGFEPVSIGDRNKQHLQISDQFTPIFLLNLPGSAIADLLSDVAQLDEINGAMRLVTKDRKDASSQRKVRDSDVITLEKNLLRYDGLDLRDKEIRDIERSLLTYQALDVALSKVRGFIEGLSGVARAIKSWTLTLQPNLPDEAPLREKASRLTLISSWISRVEATQTAFKALRSATKFDVPDLTSLTSLGSRHTQVASYYAALAAREDVVKRLWGVDNLQVPHVEPLRESRSQIVEVAALEKRWSAFEGFLTRFDTFSAIDVSGTKLQQAQSQFSSLQALDRFLGQHESLNSDVDRLEAALAKVDTTLVDIEAEFAEIGVCPTCSQPVKPGEPCGVTV